MRILHVISLASPTGEFGGPVRVALNLGRGLERRGHSVVVAGGQRGYPECPRDLEGVPATLFPVHSLSRRLGFSGLVSPRLYSWLWRNVADFDVVHVHLAREPQTLAAAEIALAKGVPVILQTHGMVDPSSRALARVIDVRMRRILARATRVLFLTETERRDLEHVSHTSDLPLEHLPNGVPLAETVRSPESREGIVYLARLAARKRPGALVDAVMLLHEDGFPVPPVLFAGPDEGERAGLMRRLESLPPGVSATYVGALSHDDGQKLVAGAQMLVLPAVDEPFPMSVLEALSLGTPVVVTDSCGLAPVVRDRKCGAVSDTTVRSLADSMKTVLEDAVAMSRDARATATSYSIESVTGTLEAIYESVLASSTSRAKPT